MIFIGYGFVQHAIVKLVELSECGVVEISEDDIMIQEFLSEINNFLSFSENLYHSTRRS